MLQSIYTHAGCDYGCLYTYSPRHCFNPHTHAGCDNVHNVSGASFPVSIHTPTQGVTFLYICNVFRICFNPHTHAGCDNPLPRLTRVHNRFNPHTHAGCDSRSIIKITESKVSIHTPTQGVTMENQMLIQLFSVSIHTPTQGVTGRAARAASQEGFNPHTHAGCDLTIFNSLSIISSFNPHTHAGCDIFMLSISTHIWCFNPHTHAGCDIICASSFETSLVSIHTPTQGVTKCSLTIVSLDTFQSTHPRRV